jgi:hypothetical protein
LRLEFPFDMTQIEFGRIGADNLSIHFRRSNIVRANLGARTIDAARWLPFDPLQNSLIRLHRRARRAPFY